jgi:hypothetical protein
VGPLPAAFPIRAIAFVFVASSLLLFSPANLSAQVTVLMEEPYGFFGVVSPGGHSAVYLERVCAETPLRVRRCKPGELGAVITREPNVGGLDWLAIPLVPYLYSVDDVSEVPSRVNSSFVWKSRNRYHESRLRFLGEKVTRSSLVKGGWDLLVGVAYERRIFAFRFESTPEQDDALIARLNSERNHTHFHYLFNNCSDFTRKILSVYFPGKFRRSIFPDLGLSSPRQVTVRLVRYARKHPALNLRVFEISQIPGFRRASGTNRTVIGSLTTRGFAVPIALLSPYAAGGMVLDYLAEGRFRLIPRDAPVIKPHNLHVLKTPSTLSVIATDSETTAVTCDTRRAEPSGELSIAEPPPNKLLESAQ